MRGRAKPSSPPSGSAGKKLKHLVHRIVRRRSPVARELARLAVVDDGPASHVEKRCGAVPLQHGPRLGCLVGFRARDYEHGVEHPTPD